MYPREQEQINKEYQELCLNLGDIMFKRHMILRRMEVLDIESGEAKKLERKPNETSSDKVDKVTPTHSNLG